MDTRKVTLDDWCKKQCEDHGIELSISCYPKPWTLELEYHDLESRALITRCVDIYRHNPRDIDDVMRANFEIMISQWQEHQATSDQTKGTE